MNPQAIVITQPIWQTFCTHFPDAAQWLTLAARLQPHMLPSLTPDGGPATFLIATEEHGV